MNKDITFDDFSLDKNILDAIKKKGFVTPSEIQAKCIPIILENKHDIVGIAQTGTGKTAAFGLPMINVINSNNKTPKAIILAPTRELAIQVCEELKEYAQYKKLNLLTVYGGSPITTQIKELNRGVDIVVGTPGRVLDLINRRILNLSEISYFVLDEADEMLKMGFIEDIETILEGASSKKRVYLFSATMPEKIKQLTKKYMKKQVVIEVEKTDTVSKLIKQEYFIAKHSEKIDIIRNVIDSSDFFYGIIFCKTKVDVENVKDMLRKDGYPADCIHGDIMQNKRERILTKFREQKLNILVATDVAARGIDINNLTHVINYSLPRESETYTHRIGRTGRAGNSGTAISLITQKETRELDKIKRELKITIERGILPNKADIKEAKGNKMSKKVEMILKSKSHTKFAEQSEKLIEEFGAVDALSAILSELNGNNSFEEDSSSSSRGRDRNESSSRGSKDSSSRDRDDSSRDRKDYGRGDLRKTSSRNNSSDNNNNKEIRLFVAKGKMDGFHKKESLISYLEKESRVENIRGFDVKVCDKFSFVTLRAKEAEMIIEEFDKRGGRPIVEIAAN